MKDYFEYNGYKGSVETSIEDEVLHGEILFINDLVTYEADSLGSLKEEFENAVDDYLKTCKLLNKDPDKAFSGSFQVRVTPELHRKMALQAQSEGKNQSKYVTEAIQEKLNDNIMQVNHTHNVEHNVIVSIESQNDIEIPNQVETQWKAPIIHLNNTQQKRH